MSWLRLEGRMANHEKVSGLSDAAFRLHVTTMMWCVDAESDGRVAKHVPGTLPRAPNGKTLARVLVELVDAELWERTEEGFLIHDFLNYNPSAAQSKAARAAKVAAGAAGGRAKAGGHGGKTLAAARADAKQEPSEPIAAASENSSSRAGPRARSDSDSDSETESRQQPPERADGRERCPVPVPIPPETIANLELGVGMPADVATAAIMRFSLKNSAKAADLRTQEAWISSAMAAITGDWSDPKRRAEMRTAVAQEPIAAPAVSRLAVVRAADERARAEAAEALKASQSGSSEPPGGIPAILASIGGAP